MNNPFSKRNVLVYVAGPYSAYEGKTRDENIEDARKTSAMLWEAGYTVHCPHLNTAKFDDFCNCSWEDYINGDLVILGRCDVLFLFGDWKESKGTLIEVCVAQEREIPIFEKFEDLNYYIDNMYWSYGNTNRLKITRGEK